GSVRLVTDGLGAVLDRIEYDAFGRRAGETAPGVAGRYGYTGREADDDLGLQYNRARWYDPVAGRWTGEDPEGFDAGDSNLSRYVGNGPTNATDPSGLEPPDPRLTVMRR